MARRERESGEHREGEEIQISFGAIHTYPHNKKRSVIIDVGEDDHFTASQILPRGRLALPATERTSNIDKIVGYMEVDEVLKGLKMTTGETSPRMEAAIREHATRLPRLLRR